jgi:hypothetical protein
VQKTIWQEKEKQSSKASLHSGCEGAIAPNLLFDAF